jgi:DNA-binding protein H-NS
MAENAVEQEAPEPSTGVSDVEKQPAETPQVDQSPPSSDEAESTEDLLSVLEDVVKPQEDEPEPTEELAEAATAIADEKSEPVDVRLEQSEEIEDFKDVPFNKHPRFRQVIQERKEFKQQAEDYREKASHFDQVVEFMNQNHLTPDEMAEGVRIMALMKSDPLAAKEAMQPHLENLGRYTGEVLPEDIESRLTEGYIDRDTATELAQARMQAEILNAREIGMQQQSVEAEQARIQNAVVSWEGQTRSTDPDFAMKETLISDRVRGLVAERGQPRTVDEGVSMAKEAYESVNDHLRKFAGDPKQPVTPVGGGKVSGSPIPAPTSLQEAMEQAVRR